MVECKPSPVSHPLEAEHSGKLFLVRDASPMQVQFATVSDGRSLELVPGPAWVEQDGRRVRISLLEPAATGVAVHDNSSESNESCLPPSVVNDEGLSPSQFRRVLSFISKRLSSNLTLSQLAREAGLSTAYFSQRFKSSTGTSPHQYLLRLRVCKAKRMLEESEAPVIDIAAECGFQTQQHFARIFRRLTAKTPTEYRREKQLSLLVSTYANLTSHRELML